MTAKILTTRVAADTGGGTQDITISGFGTPKAALFYATLLTANGQMDTGVYATGATDGTNQFSNYIYSEDNVGTAVTRKGQFDTRCLTIGNTSVLCDCHFTSWITDGVRITWDTTPPSAYLITVVLFGGTDISAFCDTRQLGVLDTHVTDVGFEADLVFLNTSWNASLGVSINSYITQGIVWNQSTVVNRHVSYVGDDGAATSSSTARVGSLKSGQQVWEGALYRTVNLTNFDSDGFNIIASDTFAYYVHYLAIKIENHSVSVGTYDTPTSTGNHSISGLSFKPKFGMFVQSFSDAINTLEKTDPDTNIFGISVFDSINAYSNQFADKDNLITTQTKSVGYNKPVYIDIGDASPPHMAADFVSFNSDGVTLDYTVVDGTSRKFVYLLIEGDEVSGTIIPKIQNYIRMRKVA